MASWLTMVFAKGNRNDRSSPPIRIKREYSDDEDSFHSNKRAKGTPEADHGCDGPEGVGGTSSGLWSDMVEEELFPAIKREREADEEVKYLNYPQRKQVRMGEGKIDIYGPNQILDFVDS